MPHTRRFIPTLCLMVLLATAVTSARAGGVPGLPSPPQDIVDMARNITWRYYYGHDKSAHTNAAASCGRQFTLALAARAGNASAEYRMFRQLRYNLQGGQCLVAAGGYGAQHEMIFTGTCALVRHSPHLWNQLTADEQHKVDLLMKAALVASAYTTSDLGNSTGQNTDLMGGTNLSRGWNPNFREGMFGAVIVATAYLGGADAAYEFLNSYDHATFCAELNAAGLTNTYITFNYRVDHPSSGAPSAYAIQNDIHDYHAYGIGLDDLMGLYHNLTTDTYDKHVNEGLNGGAGIGGCGRMLGGQAGLPDRGALGMLTEFDSGDGGGSRSSAGYAYSGYRPNLINQAVLMAGGYWEEGTRADECLARMPIGIEDLFYKLDHGYRDYANGHCGGDHYMTDDGHDYYMSKSWWYDVLTRYHDGLVAVADAGGNRTVADIDLNGFETVTLDGTGSFGAGGAPIVDYLWTRGATVLATTATADVTLAAGTSDVALTVTDSGGQEATALVRITVETPDLLANAGADQTLADADGDGAEPVMLDGSGSFARDTTITNYVWSFDDGSLLAMGETAFTVLPVGEHAVTLTITDSGGAKATDDVVITVQADAATPGDADGDGDVDLDDFAVLKQNFGTAAGATWADGDFDGDGDVDLDDFAAMKQNFGT
ncbi:MAG: PKD domain-containing protein [Planctomycetota bacterium]